MMIDPAMFPIFGQTIIRSVDAGHVVAHNGKTLIVEKGRPVYRQHEIFMEHEDYKAFRDHPEVTNWIEPKWN